MSSHILAYLDPTTGSVAYQIALSTALAAAAAVKMYWKKLKKLFRGKTPEISNKGQVTESQQLR